MNQLMSRRNMPSARGDLHHAPRLTNKGRKQTFEQKTRKTQKEKLSAPKVLAICEETTTGAQNMKTAVTVFLLLLVFFLAAPVYASNVTIKVESVFLQPIENCFVMLDGVEGITDSNGTVFFEGIESGNYSLRVVREGKIINSSVLVGDGDTKKGFTIMTQGDWQILSFLGLAAAAVIAVAFLFSRIKLDKREPYGSQLRRGKRWDRG